MRRLVGIGLATTIAALGAASVPGWAAPGDGVHVSSFRAPAAVTYGERASVSGRIAPAAAVPVTIERLTGGAWKRLATVRSDARGRFAAELPLRRGGSLRATVAGVDGAPLPGPRKNVTVRRKASLTVTAAHRYEAISGRPFAVTGAVVPARRGERVVLEGSRDGRAYAPIARLRLKSGRVSGTVTPPRGGKWRFRLTAGGETPAASAPTAAQRVFDKNPHGVPASAPKYLVQKISEAQLYYYESGRLVRVLPVVFGKPSTPTPVGNYRVYSKTVGPGPAFGPLAMWYHRGYGIHGTNQEYLLERSWRYYSHGCTRNYNVNIYWLWDRVPVGTPVKSLA